MVEGCNTGWYDGTLHRSIRLRAVSTPAIVQTGQVLRQVSVPTCMRKALTYTCIFVHHAIYDPSTRLWLRSGFFQWPLTRSCLVPGLERCLPRMRDFRALADKLPYPAPHTRKSLILLLTTVSSQDQVTAGRPRRVVDSSPGNPILTLDSSNTAPFRRIANCTTVRQNGLCRGDIKTIRALLWASLFPLPNRLHRLSATVVRDG